VIVVACSNCPWQATFSRAELISNYGAGYPLPKLLDDLAAPGMPEDQETVGSVRRLLCQPNRRVRTVAAVDTVKGRSAADPFVIALAATTNPFMLVVTEEFAGKSRIPDVCVAEKIDSCRLADLIERELISGDRRRVQ
jgi:hypothetical protein